MGETVKSLVVQQAFLDALKHEGAVVLSMRELTPQISQPLVREHFEELGRASRKVFHVKGLGLVYIRVRSKSPGWWNIMKSVKDELDYLQELKLRRYFVFLIGAEALHKADGYIASDFESPPFIKHPRSERIKFTVHEKEHLDPTLRISSVTRMAKQLLLLGKGE